MIDYRAAGVDPARATDGLRRVRSRIEATHGPEVLANPGGFAGLFRLAGYRDPVLVSATDGVGTKLKLAIELGRFDTVGIDLVAMSVNDVLVHGARPLFFLDYVAAGRLDPERVEAWVSGCARGCELAGCALLGGETAEMPGLYRGDDFDLAGFAVGCVERDRLLPGDRVREGDALLGLASSGLHSNGFSLVRAVADRAGWDLHTPLDGLGDRPLGEVLLEPTRIYTRVLGDLLDHADLGPRVHAMAHITGDGIPGNLERVLPAGLGAALDVGSWPRPAVFDAIAAAGPVSADEMQRVFNLGLGMVAVVAADAADEVCTWLGRAGEAVYRVGRVVAGRGVLLEG